MNEKYDVVVCGTGLSECILSGLFSQERNSSLIQRRRSSILIVTPSTAVKAHPSI